MYEDSARTNTRAAPVKIKEQSARLKQKNMFRLCDRAGGASHSGPGGQKGGGLRMGFAHC